MYSRWQVNRLTEEGWRMGEDIYIKIDKEISQAEKIGDICTIEGGMSCISSRVGVIAR